MQLKRGYIACSIVTTGSIVTTSGTSDYLDRQLQQYEWTNNPPIQITTLNQIFDATWSVTGSGSKYIFERVTDPRTGQTTTKTSSLAWTVNGSQSVQLQVRLASNNQVILANSSSIVSLYCLTGTRVDTNTGMPTSTMVLTGKVDRLPPPAVQWHGPRSIDRVLEGSVDPAPVVASLSSLEIGSRLGQKRASSLFYAGSQVLPTQPTGTEYAGATAMAEWSWRIYY